MCTTRKARGESPSRFSSYDPRVIALAPTYVQNHWRRHGFHVTHRAAIRYTLVDQLRSAMARPSDW